MANRKSTTLCLVITASILQFFLLSAQDGWECYLWKASPNFEQFETENAKYKIEKGEMVGLPD